ncbi:MAG TPA: 4-hydroxythreonine-4-phosphate dehydrogenase PdxA [Steroidobacteraceae bacterium]|nr:4-hydroxythreonine-4-phosphate dehydrogenase PdxA [Steroidobacteraceae bacterium]
MSTTPRIIITSGEPAGVGPDLCLAIAQREWPAQLIFAVDEHLLQARAQDLGDPVRISYYDPSHSARAHRVGELQVMHVPVREPVAAGQLNPANARYVLDLLDRACDGCMSGEFAAMVTAPVQKSVIIDAGVPFSGHTEYLAHRSGGALPVMMLTAENLRVALVTTHLPLARVPAAIQPHVLTTVLRTLHRDLRGKFGIEHPRILVLGLNPHAGESGHLGREEIEVIQPVLQTLRAEGMRLTGPAPADTAFTPRLLEHTDAVLAMYHDQGLPVLKYAGFGHAVNVTLGLPLIRTSVDHGTALELAGKGTADAGSLIAATELAIELAHTSRVSSAA